MRLPDQGHIVSYNSAEQGRRMPAIVTGVHEYESGEFLLDLVCFFTSGSYNISAAPQGNKPGEWQWLDMVEAKEIIKGNE